MIADPKSESLIENFTGQWLNVRSLQTDAPTVSIYPDYADNLRRRSGVRPSCSSTASCTKDRSILNLLTADYTFVNGRCKSEALWDSGRVRLRLHRVQLPPESTCGAACSGKALFCRSRRSRRVTSPVSRGKWFLQTFLGVSPPESAAERAGNEAEGRRQRSGQVKKS